MSENKQNNIPKVISIVGPTASGKTGLGIALAKKLAERGVRAEIINADAYQMYRRMDIGTAKASAEEQAEVPHHLLDIIDPEETMTVARFQMLARQCIRELQSRGVRPILVGGSGLYARAAVDDITFPGTDESVRAALEARERMEGAGALFAELQRKDPVAAAHMDARNPRRTIRALEVIELTGKPYSATLPRYKYVIDCVQIGLDLQREDLDKRVNLRTQIMREQGLWMRCAKFADVWGLRRRARSATSKSWIIWMACGARMRLLRILRRKRVGLRVSRWAGLAGMRASTGWMRCVRILWMLRSRWLILRMRGSSTATVPTQLSTLLSTISDPLKNSGIKVRSDICFTYAYRKCRNIASSYDFIVLLTKYFVECILLLCA